MPSLQHGLCSTRAPRVHARAICLVCGMHAGPSVWPRAEASRDPPCSCGCCGPQRAEYSFAREILGGMSHARDHTRSSAPWRGPLTRARHLEHGASAESAMTAAARLGSAMPTAHAKRPLGGMASASCTSRHPGTRGSTARKMTVISTACGGLDADDDDACGGYVPSQRTMTVRSSYHACSAAAA